MKFLLNIWKSIVCAAVSHFSKFLKINGIIQFFVNKNFFVTKNSIILQLRTILEKWLTAAQTMLFSMSDKKIHADWITFKGTNLSQRKRSHVFEAVFILSWESLQS